MDEEFARARDGVDEMNQPQSHRDTEEEKEKIETHFPFLFLCGSVALWQSLYPKVIQIRKC